MKLITYDLICTISRNQEIKQMYSTALSFVLPVIRAAISARLFCFFMEKRKYYNMTTILINCNIH